MMMRKLKQQFKMVKPKRQKLVVVLTVSLVSSLFITPCLPGVPCFAGVLVSPVWLVSGIPGIPSIPFSPISHVALFPWSPLSSRYPLYLRNPCLSCPFCSLGILWGEISVKITQWSSRSIRVYGLFIWVQSFHLGMVWSFHSGMVFSFGHGLFIRAWSFHLGMVFSFVYGLFICIWSFHLGMVFSFAYGLFIWVWSFHLGMVLCRQLPISLVLCQLHQ